MRFILSFISCTLISLSLLDARAEDAEQKTGAELVSVQKIWDKAPHNAFTDLVFHNGEWFCVFREGDGHVSPNGALRVITSKDGETWESAARITADDSDLRDAKIAVSNTGQLVLCGAGALHDKNLGSHQSYIWYSDDGRNWSEPIPIGDRSFWLWRVTFNGDAAYAVGYQTNNGNNRGTRLYKSEDGKEFQAIVPSMLTENSPNESSLLFLEDGTGYCLSRREGPDRNAMFGTAQPPYTDWSWKNLGIHVGGPQLMQLEDGRIVVAGRRYPGGAKTQLWWLEPEQGKLTEILTLPSGGDTSYPGLVEKDGLLWVSYYSSHEGKTSIYLAKVRLPDAP